MHPQKIIIFGNSGSGKSTLAKKLQQQGLAHLDLDTLAWDMTPTLARRPIDKSGEAISTFIQSHSAWVIEGCYADLIDLALPFCNEIIFMNLSIEQCITNAKIRPWEPHKYSSKAAQDNNLDMLIHWIADYPTRTDTLSLQAHKKIYDGFSGKKTEITENTAL